jgi:hypothetical protein
LAVYPGAYAPRWRQVVPLGLSHPNGTHVVENVRVFEDGKDQEVPFENLRVT